MLGKQSMVSDQHWPLHSEYEIMIVAGSRH